MARDVCLFGGTFDPVHRGHLIIARAVAEQMGFERVTFVPTRTPPHKPPPRAVADDRLAMLKLALEGEPLFEICDLELKRDGPSYTLTTLQAIREQLGEVNLYWIIGADMLADLPSWHRVEEVLDLARVLVAARPMETGGARQTLEALADKLPPRHLESLRDSLLDTPLVDIASSDIRRRVREGKPIDDLVPPPVAEYIASHGLYRQAEPPHPAAEHP